MICNIWLCASAHSGTIWKRSKTVDIQIQISKHGMGQQGEPYCCCCITQVQQDTNALIKITKKFVWKTISWYNELCSVSDRPRSGWPLTTWAPAAVKVVAERIRRNLLCKQKIMAKEMQIPQRTMSHSIRGGLGLRIYRLHTGQLLTPALCKIRTTRAKWLLTQHAKGGHGQILFTNEKFFSV